jgi:catechol 2,3-dioxygenase-like lactoylglutathione lyase family enzyme
MESKVSPGVTALKAHLALNVANVEQSKEFYRKLFGIEPGKVRAGYAKFDVQNPPLNLTLNQGVHGVGVRGALSHLGIQVASSADVLATRARWIESGLAPRDEMQTSCCYALQDKSWVRDPDGNEWEVFFVLEDNLPETATCECGERIQLTRAEKSVAIRTAESELEANACCGSPLVSICPD